MANLYGPRIVTDGLVLHLDAANRKSYPGSGSTWYDLSGNGNNGTINSGVSYNYNSGGYFNFNGSTGGSVTLPLLSTARASITMLAITNMPASDGGAIFYNGNDGGYGFGIGGSNYDNVGNNAIGLYQIIRWIDTNVNWGTGWMLAGLLINSSGVPFLIKNGNIVGSISGTIPNLPVNNAFLGTDRNSTRFFAGDIATATFYNRELSLSEIQQNYNALKGRFGLT